ncbi:MAG: M14 family zinc carboxypeptidase [Sumerlaeia bacterium]
MAGQASGVGPDFGPIIDKMLCYEYTPPSFEHLRFAREEDRDALYEDEVELLALRLASLSGVFIAKDFTVFDGPLSLLETLELVKRQELPVAGREFLLCEVLEIVEHRVALGRDMRDSGWNEARTAPYRELLADPIWETAPETLVVVDGCHGPLLEPAFDFRSRRWHVQRQLEDLANGKHLSEPKDAEVVYVPWEVALRELESLRIPSDPRQSYLSCKDIGLNYAVSLATGEPAEALDLAVAVLSEQPAGSTAYRNALIMAELAANHDPAFVRPKGASSIREFTENQLGYPVPVPMDTTEAFEGFRSYAGLLAKGMALTLEHEHVTSWVLGQTFDGRDIVGYLLGDANDTAPGGGPEGGAFVNGTVHPREWASPEIVTQTMTFLADGYGSDTLATYLVDSLQIAFIPVLNVDGFLQTQRNPARYIGDSDGRMRRKSMNGVDEVLETEGDALNGVDLNRNFDIGFGRGSSGTPTSSLYRGPFARSEPESQVLASAAADFFTTRQLRFYADIHGAIPAIYNVFNGSQSSDAQTAVLTERMQFTFREINGVAGSYADLPVFPGGEIGATDEFMANTYKVPSFTIEYPTPRYRDPSASGPTFVLPEDEVTQTVEENRAALLLAMYYAAGPPILERMTLWRDENGDGTLQSPEELIATARWTPAPKGSAVARVLSSEQFRPLLAGDGYRVLLQFNKPMRTDGGAAGPGLYTGQDHVPFQPVVTLQVPQRTGTPRSLNLTPSTADGWVRRGAGVPTALRYHYDSWEGEVSLREASLGAYAEGQPLPLTVEVRDFYGFALDPDPRSPVGWDAGWTGLEGGTASDPGGADTNLALPKVLLNPEPVGDSFVVY